jgi:CHAT domain-containing protein
MSDRDNLLVELYWHNGRLHTFLVRPGESQPEVRSKPLSFQRLNEYMTSFQMAFARADSAERESGAWMDLASFWLEDHVGALITAASRIVIVPHGLFHHAPLHLLPFEGKPLVMTCPVSYCPSSTLLVDCHNRSRSIQEDRAADAMLVLGVNFEDEARAVHAAITSSTLRLDSEVPIDKQWLLSEWQSFPWIHFSCHGIFDLEQPMQSGLVLRAIKDEELKIETLRTRSQIYLTAEEISRSRTNAALITLSACETAQTEQLPGDEILGLTRALFLSGAASVLNSFWRVPAEPTQLFMQTLYEQLKAQPVSLSDAVQLAYITTAKQHPDAYDWGGFALTGDGLSKWKLN